MAKFGILGQVRHLIVSIPDLCTLTDLKFNDNNTRGHIFKLQKPRCNKSFRHQSFPVRCIDDCNRLPDCVVANDTVLSFKTQLDKFLSGRQFDLDQIY